MSGEAKAAAPDAASAGQPRRGLSHIAPLDGLRGTAVVFVMLFHFGWTFPEATPLAHAMKRLLWVGWVGVDLFFVLSGYLITRGLVAPSDLPVGTRLKKFWARRVLRIFPLYYVVLVVGSGVCLLASAPLPTLPYWFYFQNYALAFDTFRLRWTAHFWSLAIEEQFYFLWPLLAVLAPKKALIRTTIGLALLCIVVRAAGALQMHSYDHASQHAAAEQLARVLYRSTPTHMDGLLFGAMIAVMGRDPASRLSQVWRRVRPGVLVVTLLALVALFFLTRGFDTDDGRVIFAGYGSLALFFASVVSLAVDDALYPAVKKVIVGRFLRACGRVSYGMYVLHWPIVVFTIPWLERRQAEASEATGILLGLAVLAVGIGVTYGLAELSFRFIESPFLRLKERFHE
jgi:peptidoglycan/LPS O-acetylase OafA/YrhL